MPTIGLSPRAGLKKPLQARMSELCSITCTFFSTTRAMFMIRASRIDA